MPTGKHASWMYAERFLDESRLFPDPLIFDRARERSTELGVDPVLPGTGAVLTLLASTLDAHSVVEIGTGTGVGSLYLLAGLPAAGVLTTIDSEVENQRAARTAFTEARIRSASARTIAGDVRRVLARLNDHSYDLVTFSAAEADAVHYADEALRLLRPGGALVISNALWHDHVAEAFSPTQHLDAETVRVRDLLQSLRDDERVRSILLPSGDGVLAALVRQPS